MWLLFKHSPTFISHPYIKGTCLPALTVSVGIGCKLRGVQLSNMDLFPRIPVCVRPVTLWWWCLTGILAAAEIEPVISPNTRHYTVFTHSCLEAVRPQSSTVRHWAALWSYWNSRLLRASNKVLFETVDAVRFGLKGFVLQVNQQSDSYSHFLWVCNTGMKFCSFAQTWLALLSSSFASYQIIQRSLSVSHQDFLHHFNVMLFKLGYSLLINNEWGLTVCLVKSSASNGSALLKGVVEEGRKNQLHKCTSFTFRPVNIC